MSSEVAWIRWLMLALVGAVCASCAACASEAYAQIPGVSRIVDIDIFLRQCPAEEELAILRQDFPVFIEPADGAGFSPYVCVGRISGSTVPSDELLVYQALRVIRHMRLGESLPWTDLHPYAWLKSRINGIVISADATYSHCCQRFPAVDHPGDITAIVLKKADPFLLQCRKGWVDPQAGVGLDGLVYLIFHEARHVDVPHTCGADDATLSEMGAWGVQYTVAQWIADGRIDIGTRGNPLYRAYARASARVARERICEFDG